MWLSWVKDTHIFFITKSVNLCRNKGICPTAKILSADSLNKYFIGISLMQWCCLVQGLNEAKWHSMVPWSYKSEIRVSILELLKEEEYCEKGRYVISPGATAINAECYPSDETLHRTRASALFLMRVRLGQWSSVLKEGTEQGVCVFLVWFSCFMF